jgi:8-oxo-dGTP pyrophosphatase MutT (NUDIX family)
MKCGTHYVIGLLETGETSAEAAVRELHEETGWHGEVTHISDRLAVDPGCSSSIIRSHFTSDYQGSNILLSCSTKLFLLPVFYLN